MLSKEDLQEIQKNYHRAVPWSWHSIPSLLAHIREQDAKLAHMERAMEWLANACNHICMEFVPIDEWLHGECRSNGAECLTRTALNATKEAPND